MVVEDFDDWVNREMRHWTLNFCLQTPGWNKEPLRCCFMKRMASIGGDDEEHDEEHDEGDEDDADGDEFQLPVSPNLQSNLRSRSLSLDDWREKIASCGSCCCLRKAGDILRATAPPSGWRVRWVWRWRTRPSWLLFGDAEEKDKLQVHSIYLPRNCSKNRANMRANPLYGFIKFYFFDLNMYCCAFLI